VENGKWYSARVTYLDGLNDAQKRAVLATDGPISVLAGAGSGKTRVLTTRIYHLIREGVPAEQVLAVTFTNKAAREMRGRVRRMLDGDGLLPFIATFHGLGRELLESYGKVIGIPRFFSIYDRDDSEKAVAAALKALDVGTKEFSPRAVLGRISRAKGEGMRANEFYEKHARSGFGNRIAAEAWLRYEKTLRDEKALDFDDLIALPVRLLEEHLDIRALAQERWRYIHIDEYQDTNELQERLAGLLAGKHQNLFVVGDGDQAIYGWRGAKMENILNFEKRYPDAQTIILEHNYRSTKNLVDAANAVIEKNKNRKEKYSTTDKAAGEPIIVHIARSAEDEARWIALRIKSQMSEGQKPEEIAVLFRTNFQSRALEEGLLRAGVPYKLLGTRFFARKEVKDALAWMRLALDPSRESDKLRAAASPSSRHFAANSGSLTTVGNSTFSSIFLFKSARATFVLGERNSAALPSSPTVALSPMIWKSRGIWGFCWAGAICNSFSLTRSRNLSSDSDSCTPLLLSISSCTSSMTTHLTFLRASRMPGEMSMVLKLSGVVTMI